MSERCEQTSEQMSVWPVTYVPILGCSEPLCPSFPFSPKTVTTPPSLDFKCFPTPIIIEGSIMSTQVVSSYTVFCTDFPITKFLLLWSQLDLKIILISLKLKSTPLSIDSPLFFNFAVVISVMIVLIVVVVVIAVVVVITIVIIDIYNLAGRRGTLPRMREVNLSNWISLSLVYLRALSLPS